MVYSLTVDEPRMSPRTKRIPLASLPILLSTLWLTPYLLSSRSPPVPLPVICYPRCGEQQGKISCRCGREKIVGCDLPAGTEGQGSTWMLRSAGRVYHSALNTQLQQRRKVNEHKRCVGLAALHPDRLAKSGRCLYAWRTHCTV